MNSIQVHPFWIILSSIIIISAMFLVWNFVPVISINIFIIFGVLILLAVIGYLAWINFHKMLLMEKWTHGYIAKVVQVQQDLTRVDSTGHFESDDEIGVIFQQIKDIINSLNTLTEQAEQADK